MIQIKWTEIKKDVDKQTWRLAQVKIGDIEQQNYAQEDDTKTSETFVMRFAESGFAMVSMLLREQLEIANATTSTDALDMDKEQWEFTLKDSSSIDERALALLIHRFMVAYVLYRWSSLWAQDSAGIFKTEYTDTLSEIEEEAFSLSEPTKSKRTTAFDLSSDEEVKVTYETA